MRDLLFETNSAIMHGSFQIEYGPELLAGISSRIESRNLFCFLLTLKSSIFFLFSVASWESRRFDADDLDDLPHHPSSHNSHNSLLAPVRCAAKMWQDWDFRFGV